MSRSPWALIRAPRAAITLLAAALAGCSAAPVDPSVVVGEKLGVETPYVSATIARGSHVAWKYGSTLSVYRDRAFVRAIELDLPIHAALAADDDFVYFATLAPGKFQTAAGEPTRKVGGLYRLRWDAAAPERLIDLPVVAGALTLAEGACSFAGLPAPTPSARSRSWTSGIPRRAPRSASRSTGSARGPRRPGQTFTSRSSRTIW